MARSRPKQKVVEVLSLHCLLREPNYSRTDNPWVATVKVEVRGPIYHFPAKIITRTVTIQAKDELAAYLTLVTEGV